MPASIYRIDPDRDRSFAEEFRACPVGHHSAGLQRILNLLRGEPLKGKYVLVVREPYREWALGRLSGERAKPVVMVKGKTYKTLEEAEWDVFKLRWEAATGQKLDL